MSEPKRVMVLDDEPIVGERLKPALEKRGFEVEVFVESAAAVARLESARFDVIVTDMKMREQTGMDVLRIVKESAADTQVVVITGYATIETSHEARALGAYEFVPKPFRMKDLVSLVVRAARGT